MVLYPEAYARAQAEMDNVVGWDRLPTTDDRDTLPYLECLLKEVYRYVRDVRYRYLNTGITLRIIGSRLPRRLVCVHRLYEVFSSEQRSQPRPTQHARKMNTVDITYQKIPQ